MYIYSLYEFSVMLMKTLSFMNYVVSCFLIDHALFSKYLPFHTG